MSSIWLISYDNAQMTVAVAGATGYIGKAVVRECLRRGFKTKAYVREESIERAKTLDYLKGAEVCSFMHSVWCIMLCIHRPMPRAV